MRIFNVFNRKKVSIYRKILETNFDIEALKNLNLSDGSYEYNIITKKESIKSISTRQLNNALDDFYGRQNSALEEFDDFFRKNRALEAQRPFLVNLMQKIEFSEDKLLGLSILLMRDSTVEESVKFGMLLSKYYDLRNYSKVEIIFKNLMKHPSFMYYGLEYLMSVDYGQIDDLYDKTFFYGKKIIEEKVWN